VQEKVVAHLSDAEQKECRWWVLDIGATNHMTGCKSAFSDLDRAIHGTIRFGDGSMVQIEGMGTVLFSGKNGEHRAFTGVYYIPRLTTNIIGVGQLDEMGYKTLIDNGVMRIRDLEHRLIVKVNHSNNRLYVLEAEIAAPVCLAMSAWLWHARFGHLNFPALRKLARDDMVYQRWSRWTRFAAGAWLASITGRCSHTEQSTGRRRSWNWYTETCAVPSPRRHRAAAAIFSSSSTITTATCGCARCAPRIKQRWRSSSSSRSRKQRQGGSCACFRVIAAASSPPSNSPSIVSSKGCTIN
jgi:hypothetical protein